eukprot:6457266-Amphidinium_carterae.1
MQLEWIPTERRTAGQRYSSLSSFWTDELKEGRDQWYSQATGAQLAVLEMGQYGVVGKCGA